MSADCDDCIYRRRASERAEDSGREFSQAEASNVSLETVISEVSKFVYRRPHRIWPTVASEGRELSDRRYTLVDQLIASALRHGRLRTGKLVHSSRLPASS